MKVLEFINDDNSSPYQIWFDGLDNSVAVKITAAKLRLEFGNTSAVKWFQGIGEYVINSGPGYRIYLAKDGDKIIILYGGGIKNGQQQDIDNAKKLHAKYKAAKKPTGKAVKKQH